MRAMISHHSIAILTSERSELTDLRVSELADYIILAQRREIVEMNWLIDDIAENGEVRTDAELEVRPVPEFIVTNGRDELSDGGYPICSHCVDCETDGVMSCANDNATVTATAVPASSRRATPAGQGDSERAAWRQPLAWRCS